MTIDYWDVGQGDCSVITRPDGKLTIIDVGPKGSPILSWLRDATSARISDIVLTHNDADHMGAMPALLQEFAPRVDRVWILRDGRRRGEQKGIKELLSCLKRAHEEHGLSVQESRSDIELWVTEEPATKLSILFPSIWDAVLNQSDPNHGGAILALKHASGDEVIWPGDHNVGKTSEVVGDGLVAMLMGPHHGAPRDCLKPDRRKFYEPIDNLSPARVFVSVGSRNSYDHPNPRYLTRLQGLGCSISCSGLTRLCDRKLKSRDRGSHLINGAALLGLRRTTSGIACRGAFRLEVDHAGFQEDENEERHRSKVRELDRPFCLPRKEWKRNRGRQKHASP